MRIDYRKLGCEPQRAAKVLRLFQLADGCDANISDTFRLANQLRDSPQMLRCVDRLMQSPAARDMIIRRQLHDLGDINELAKLEAGTLGNIYYQLLGNEGLSYHYGPPPERFHNIETDADYVNYRIFATHDFHHIVSGFALNIFGEAGARSLLVAQCGYPPMALTDIVNLLSSWLDNDIIPGVDDDEDGVLSQSHLLDVMAAGIRMANQCVQLFGVDWRHLLTQPLSRVRAMLNITPFTQGRSSWHSQYGVGGHFFKEIDANS